ncbi:hypothetical protein OTU49_008383 [Cherax quadricarinatus]|uniref:Uncharacterized protein n=1 Tax=Cherax quadricarinatus TaxID=27406 RepID=A0AAW0WRB2_CHEQU
MLRGGASVLVPPRTTPVITPSHLDPPTLLTSTHIKAVDQQPMQEPKLEPKWKPRLDSRWKPKVEMKPEPKPEEKLKPRVESRWKPKVEMKPEPKPEEKLKPRLESRWKPKVETKPELKAETKPELKPEAKLELKPESKPEELKPKLESRWKPKVESKPEPKPEQKPEPRWKPRPDLKSEPEPELTPKPKWKSKPEPKSEPKPEPMPEPEPEPETTAEDDASSDLLCPLCSELYDDEQREPVLLPRCGHTFCRPCLSKDVKKGHFPCPTCRKRHLKPTVDQLPVQADLLARAEAFRESKMGVCERHEAPLAYWCRDCRKSLCAKCSVLRGHDVIRTKVLLEEKRREMREQGVAVLQSVEQEKQKILVKVKECSLQLLRTCDASALADSSAHDVKDMLTDTKCTADLHFLMGSLMRMKSILGSLGRTSNESEAENKTPRVRRRRERRDSHRSDTHTPPDTKPSTPTNHRRERNTNATATTNTITASTTTTASSTTTTNNNRNQRNHTSTQFNLAPPMKKKSVDPSKDVKYAHYSQMYGTHGISGSCKAEVSSHGPLLGFLDPALWPLRCCVYDDDGRRAKMAWEDGRLHMYALGDNIDDAHFMIRLSVLQSVIPEDTPEVFLDLTARGRRLGRVYIRLWGHLRRAQHYLALCMGTHGPSYRGAKFEEVYSRGLKGECLHGGPYLTPNGDLSAQGVMDNLEWEGKYKGRQRKGLVVGAGSGRPDRDSCFDICTIENCSRDFACPFGEVVAGWEAVLAAVNHKPVREVTMQEVGVVVTDSARPN